MYTHPYIQELQVRDLSLFDDLKASFTPGINIIIGPNACGKTSLLRAITFCFNANALGLFKYQKSTHFEININDGGHANFKAGFEAMSDNNDIYHNTSALVSGKTLPAPSYIPFPGQVPYNLLAIGAHRFFEYKEVQFIKKEDDTSKAKKTYDTNNTEYIDKPGLPSIKQWMVNRYFQIDKDWAEIERSNWEAIINNLSKLAPNENEFKLKEIGRDLEPIFELDGKVCYLEELSSGYKSVLSIVFSIIQWIELVNKDEKRRIEKAEGTVLIDEIDSHLHPSWQAKIMPVLQTIFPSLQFIVSTHSPLVMSTIRNDQNNSIQKLIYRKDEGYRCEKIQTYGNDATSILTGTLETVPRDIDSDNSLKTLFSLIDDEQYEEAENKLIELKKIYGEMPDLIQAESMLTFLLPEK